MAKTKNAPNAARVSLYVPAENKYEYLVLWHSFRGLCRYKGTSVFRELIKFIQRELRENPVNSEAIQFMEDEVHKNGLDSIRKAPITKENSERNPNDISFG